MHYHVTGIDQNPIGVRHALDVDLANAGFFELAHDVISQRADVTGRAARRHDQHIRERRFAANVDGDDVFGFVVFERGQNHARRRFDINATRRPFSSFARGWDGF